MPLLKDAYAGVNGIRLHYVTAGTGRPILFLHGFPEFWYAWKKQLLDLGRHFEATAVDLRGYNLSDKPEAVEQYRIEHLVEDVDALADHLGHRKIVLVGHDWGGVIAWVFAAAHPERIERLVIINAPHPTIFRRELRENPKQREASAYMLLFRRPDAEQFLSVRDYEALRGPILDRGIRQGYFSEEDREAYLEAWSQPGALTGGLNYYRAAGIGPPSEGEATPESEATDPVMVNVPTLMLWGERDEALLTGNLDGLERYVPNLTVRRIPDGSHWVVHEKPGLVSRAIREFIRA